MFNRKKTTTEVKDEIDIINELNKMSSRIDELETEIKQLKCAHNEVKFFKGAYLAEYDSYIPCYGYSKCCKCGLLLEWYPEKTDYKKAYIEYLKNKLEIEEMEIEKLKE